MMRFFHNRKNRLVFFDFVGFFCDSEFSRFFVFSASDFFQPYFNCVIRLFWATIFSLVIILSTQEKAEISISRYQELTLDWGLCEKLKTFSDQKKIFIK